MHPNVCEWLRKGDKDGTQIQNEKMCGHQKTRDPKSEAMSELVSPDRFKTCKNLPKLTNRTADMLTCCPAAGLRIEPRADKSKC